jgi:predicted DNA-binding transcriptional regulator AlpA
MLEDYSDVLTLADMSAIFHRSERTCLELRQRGEFPEPMPQSGHPRWSKAEVIRWLNGDRVARRGLRRVG